jgi:hypothetical protein
MNTEFSIQVSQLYSYIAEVWNLLNLILFTFPIIKGLNVFVEDGFDSMQLVCIILLYLRQNHAQYVFDEAFTFNDSFLKITWETRAKCFWSNFLVISFDCMYFLF